MRKLAWVTLGFGIASVICAYWFPSWIWIAAVAVPIFGFLVLTGQKYFRFLRVITAICIGFSLGAAWFCCYDLIYLSDARKMDSLVSGELLEVKDYPYASSYGYAVDVNYQRNGKNYHAIAYLKEDPSAAPGDILQGDFRFRFTAFGGEKDPSYRRASGIFLTLQQTGEITLHKAEAVPLTYYPAILNRQIQEKIDRFFPADTVAFAKGLLLGDKIDLSYEDYTAFRLSGISHIIAVSGLHVGILIALVYFLTGKRRFLSCILGIPLLFAFAAVVGFKPSVNRACMMQALFLISLALDREYDGITALSFAALIMMVLNPMVVIDIGFQLSFASVMGIFLFAGRVHQWFLRQKWMGVVKGKQLKFRLKRWFIASVSVTVSATLATTPLVSYYFGAVSLLGVLTNLLILWVVPLIFYGIGVIILLGTIFETLPAFVVLPVAILIRYVIVVARIIASIPFAAVYTANVYTVVWLISVYLLIAAFCLLRNKSVPALLLSMVILLILTTGFAHAEPMLDDVRMTALDVGQGQCIVISCDGKHYMVDCGGTYDTSAADTAAETLISQGIRRIDGVILTHFDRDHFGGLLYLSKRIDIDSLYYPDVPEAEDIRTELDYALGKAGVAIRQDISLPIGSAKMDLYPSLIKKSDNESCLSILFRHEKCAILITGDQTVLGEFALLKEHDIPKVDVLIAGHHGSKNSTGDYLLRSVLPDIAVISVGSNNGYNLPAPELLQRLYQYGCTVYRTDLNGTIVYRR